MESGVVERHLLGRAEHLNLAIQKTLFLAEVCVNILGIRPIPELTLNVRKG